MHTSLSGAIMEKIENNSELDLTRASNTFDQGELRRVIVEHLRVASELSKNTGDSFLVYLTEMAYLAAQDGRPRTVQA